MSESIFVCPRNHSECAELCKSCQIADLQAQVADKAETEQDLLCAEESAARWAERAQKAESTLRRMAELHPGPGGDCLSYTELASEYGEAIEQLIELKAQVAEVTDLVVQGHQLGVTADDGQYRYIPKDYWDAIIKVLDRPTASEDG